MAHLENKITNLHNSDAYGILIETGCGLAVSNALFEVSGASNTIFFVESPYSKIYQDRRYSAGQENKARAVSKENIDRFISYHEMELKKAAENLNKDAEKLNFIYASSFQLGEGNDKSTHGWIGIWTKHDDKTKYFHISIHESLTRKQYLDKISQIGIDLLYYCTVTKDEIVPSNCCIDIILDENGNDTEWEKVFVTVRNEDDENFICVKDGKLVRMEDLFRDQETIVLYKGSFNPIHVAHIHNAEVAKLEYGINPVFVISSSVYGKGWINPTELKDRVKILNELGFSVIITKDGYFNKNTEYIRRKFKQPIVYVVGSDTMNRILESSYNILNPRESERFEHFGHQMYQIRSHEKKEVSKEDLYENEKMALSVYLRKFKEDFVNVKFFVINRPGSELKENAIRVEDYYTLVEEHPEFFHISSTKIREMKENNDIEGMKKLIPEKIFEMYIKSQPKNK
jgi:nicotinic acid mononucleotide adenylyltransferase